jgi:hypothetical protein
MGETPFEGSIQVRIVFGRGQTLFRVVTALWMLNRALKPSPTSWPQPKGSSKKRLGRYSMRRASFTAPTG